MAIRAECGHFCASCHGRPGDARTHVPSARAADSDRIAAGELDRIGEDETWLWRLVVEAERVMRAAPPAPDPQRTAEADERYELARRAEERIRIRIQATEAALARPGSWLRPAHRAALVRHLKEDRAAAVAAAVHRGRIEDVRNRLHAVAATRAEYLSRHRATLDAGRNARVELDRIFDDLIDAYARLKEPPAWFRYGIGFPPEPGTQREWLSQAREMLAQRRRLALEQPKW